MKFTAILCCYSYKTHLIREGSTINFKHVLFSISNNLSFVFRDINPNNPNTPPGPNPNNPLSQEEKALIEETFNSVKNIISLPENSAHKFSPLMIFGDILKKIKNSQKEYLIKKAVAKGLDINEQASYGTALSLAVERGNYDIVLLH